MPQKSNEPGSSEPRGSIPQDRGDELEMAEDEEFEDEDEDFDDDSEMVDDVDE